MPSCGGELREQIRVFPASGSPDGKGADVLGDLYRYEWANGISATEDLTHPVVVIHDLVWSAKRDILSAQTEEELAKIEAEFDFAGRFLSGIGAAANA